MQKSPSPLRVVHVGCGGISNAWFNGIKPIPDLEIVGLVDMRLESAQAKAKEHGLEVPCYTDLAEALEALKPDAVFDATIPQAHTAVVCAALEAGCHVLGEKPMSDTLAAAQTSVLAARRTGNIYSVIQNYRYTPPVRTLREVLKSGVIGEVHTMRAEFSIGAHFDGFRAEMEHVMLTDMSIHHFDIARFLSGGDPADVYCVDYNPPGSWYRHGANAHAIFQFKGGLVFNYSASWCAEGHGTPWSGAWRIIGSKGTVMWDGADVIHYEVPSNNEGFLREVTRTTIPIMEGNELTRGHESVMRQFAEALRTGTPPETHCEDNIKSLAMVFSAIESAEKKQVVPVETGV